MTSREASKAVTMLRDAGYVATVKSPNPLTFYIEARDEQADTHYVFHSAEAVDQFIVTGMFSRPKKFMDSPDRATRMEEARHYWVWFWAERTRLHKEMRELSIRGYPTTGNEDAYARAVDAYLAAVEREETAFEEYRAATA